MEKVFDPEEDVLLFTIKSTVLLFSIGELPGKEGHRVPDTVKKLFTLATDCPVRGVHQDAGPGIQVRLLEEGGQCLSRLGREES